MFTDWSDDLREEALERGVLSEVDLSNGVGILQQLLRLLHIIADHQTVDRLVQLLGGGDRVQVRRDRIDDDQTVASYRSLQHVQVSEGEFVSR